MKSLVLVASIVLSSLVCVAGPSDKLIDALITVESKGDDYAIGDNGKAVGCLQMWKVVVDDVNEVSKTKYTYADRYDREKSIKMCRIYLSRYATKKRLGHIPTDEDYARIWNGGPKGHKKAATIAYWNKVKSHLSQSFLVC